MKRKILKLIKRPFVQSVIVMVTGTAVAQIIKMALSPIVTRLYDPAAVGVMGFFNTVIQIIIPIAAFTYPMAIVLPRSDFNAKKLMRLSVYISLLMATVLTGVLLIFNQKIVELFNISEISSYLYLIPIVIVFSTFMQVFEQWFIRIKQFRVNAKSMFFQAIIVEGGKVGIGLFNPIAPVLVVLTVFKNGIQALFMMFFGRNQFSNTSKVSQEGSLSTRSLAKKYKDFPFLRAPQMFIDAGSQGLPILMLTSLFSKASAGFFAICNTVLTIPSSLIGKAVGNVFYPRINEAAIKGEKLTHLIKKAIYALVLVGIIPFGLLVAFGPWFFGFVFGSNWAIAGEYARWLSLSRFIRFINEPCIRVLPVLSAQSLHLSVTVVQTIIRVFSLLLGFFMFRDDQTAIALYGISGAIINLLLIIITLNISGKFDYSELRKKRQ